MSGSMKMKWFRRAACRTLAALLLIPAGAFASDLISLSVAGAGPVSYYSQSFSPSANPSLFTLFPDSVGGPDTLFTFDLSDPAGRFTVDADVFLFPDYDTITYAFTAGNYSDQSLAFTFSIDMNLTSALPYHQAELDITGNGTAALPFTASPVGTGPNAAIMGASASVNFNSPPISLRVDDGTACSSGAESVFTCSYAPADSTFAPTQYAVLQGNLAFDLPGSNKPASNDANYMGWNGNIALIVTPEPASVFLIGGGLVALVCARRRRGRR